MFDTISHGENQRDGGDFIPEIPVSVRPVFSRFFGNGETQKRRPAVSPLQMRGEKIQIFAEPPFEEADLDRIVIWRFPLPLARFEKRRVEDGIGEIQDGLWRALGRSSRAAFKMAAGENAESKSKMRLKSPSESSSVFDIFLASTSAKTIRPMVSVESIPH